MIDCLIIDDDLNSNKILHHYISKVKELNLLASFDNALNGIEFLEHNLHPQIAFIHIDMRDISGLDVAAYASSKTAIVFYTSTPSYALSAFETNVYDFILEPITFSRFLKTVNKIRALLDFKNSFVTNVCHNYIFVNPGVKGKLIKISVDEIIYIEGLKNFIRINLLDERHITYLTMHEIEAALPKSEFVRIHKSFLINSSKIKSLEGNKIIISGKISLPIGDSYREQIINSIRNNTVVTKRKN